MKRLEWLDGLRGIMALIVIVNHFVVVFYPQMYYDSFAQNSGGGGMIFCQHSPILRYQYL